VVVVVRAVVVVDVVVVVGTVVVVVTGTQADPFQMRFPQDATWFATSVAATMVG
jgi:hypothetical protein